MLSAVKNFISDKPKDSEEVVFAAVKASSTTLISAAINKLFKGKQYNQTHVATWISQFNEECIKQLINNNGNFKYIVKTMVLEK